LIANKAHHPKQTGQFPARQGSKWLESTTFENKNWCLLFCNTTLHHNQTLCNLNKICAKLAETARRCNPNLTEPVPRTNSSFFLLQSVYQSTKLWKQICTFQNKFNLPSPVRENLREIGQVFSLTDTTKRHPICQSNTPFPSFSIADLTNRPVQ
jgi:hypothetical protein